MRISLKTIRNILNINFIVIVFLHIFLWVVVAFGISLADTFKYGLIGFVALDILLLADRLVNHKIEVFRYLILAVVSSIMDLIIVSKSAILFIFEIGLLSFFLMCLLIQFIVKRINHRFKLTDEWGFFLDPINFLFSFLIIAVSAAATAGMAILFHKL